jgi:hypothetical protein
MSSSVIFVISVENLDFSFSSRSVFTQQLANNGQADPIDGSK